MRGWQRLTVDDKLSKAERNSLRERQAELLNRLRQTKREYDDALEAFAADNNYDLDDISERRDARDAFGETKGGKAFEGHLQKIKTAAVDEYKRFLAERFDNPNEETKKDRIAAVMRAYGDKVYSEALMAAVDTSYSYMREFKACQKFSDGVRHYDLGAFDQGKPAVALKREPRRTDSLSSKRRKKVLQRDAEKCLRCGSTANLEVHHIVPVSRGGSHDIGNTATLCHDCHNDARLANPPGGEVPAYPPGEFKAWLDDDLDIYATKTNQGTRCQSPKGSCPHHDS